MVKFIYGMHNSWEGFFLPLLSLLSRGSVWPLKASVIVLCSVTTHKLSSPYFSYLKLQLTWPVKSVDYVKKRHFYTLLWKSFVFSTICLFVYDRWTSAVYNPLSMSSPFMSFCALRCLKTLSSLFLFWKIFLTNIYFQKYIPMLQWRE